MTRQSTIRLLALVLLLLALTTSSALADTDAGIGNLRDAPPVQLDDGWGTAPPPSQHWQCEPGQTCYFLCATGYAVEVYGKQSGAISCNAD